MFEEASFLLQENLSVSCSDQCLAECVNLYFPMASFGRREWNGMEMNKKNNFRIFPFPCLGVLMEGIESSFPCLRV